MNTPFAKILFQPLAITEAGARQLRSLIFSAAQKDFSVKSESAEKPEWMTMDYLGNKIPAPYDLEDGTRVIPLHGPITRGYGLMGKYYGMADTDEFNKWVNEAAADRRVTRIALYVKSPGGDAIGCYEAAQAVANAGKPTLAFTDDVMASAAYFISSACDVIYATPSSIGGSIGTYVTLVDDTAYWSNLGISYIVVRSGKYKGAGIDGFTPEQLAEIQTWTDAFGEQFRAFVESRPNRSVSRDIMEGQVFLGKDLTLVNLADISVNSFQEAINNHSANF